MMEWAALVLDI